MVTPGAVSTDLGSKFSHRIFCKSHEPGCAFSSLKGSQVVLGWVDHVMGSLYQQKRAHPLISLSSPDFQGKPRPHQHSDEHSGAPPLCTLREDTPPPVAQPHRPADRAARLRHSAGVLTAAGPGMASAGPRTRIQPDTELSPGLEPALRGPGHPCCRGGEGLQSCHRGWLVISLFLSFIYQMPYIQT